ncbi:uncharacterized protein LOC142351159 [Convolutriloba macropyga]|uniref:uncharacterized protein LOC142351159 n=1 Tax=Convolutriloba macropyga TaxID=536237 RepID=UPI003F521743
MSTGCLCFPSLNLNSINFGRAPVGDHPELNSGSSTERSASERRVRAVTITDRIFRSQRAVIHYHYPNSDEQATQSRSSRRSRRSFIRNRRNTSSNNESHSSPSSTGVTSACNVCASCPVGDEDGVDSSSTNMYLQLMPNDVKQLHVAVMKNDAITVGKLIEQG